MSLERKKRVIKTDQHLRLLRVMLELEPSEISTTLHIELEDDFASHGNMPAELEPSIGSHL